MGRGSRRGRLKFTVGRGSLRGQLQFTVDRGSLRGRLQFTVGRGSLRGRLHLLWVAAPFGVGYNTIYCGSGNFFLL